MCTSLTILHSVNDFNMHHQPRNNNNVQGRNDMAIFTITRELGILTWDEAFLSLRCTLLPDAIRAKYCELIIGQSCFSHSFIFLVTDIVCGELEAELQMLEHKTFFLWMWTKMCDLGLAVRRSG